MKISCTRGMAAAFSFLLLSTFTARIDAQDSLNLDIRLDPSIQYGQQLLRFHGAAAASLSIPVDAFAVTNFLPGSVCDLFTREHNFPSMEPNPSNFVYTIPYYEEPSFIISHVDTPLETLDELVGKRYAGNRIDRLFRTGLASRGLVVSGTTDQSIPDSLMQVARGEADYSILPLASYLLTVKEFKLERVLRLSRPVFTVYYRFGVSRDRAGILPELNDQILRLYTSGVLNTLTVQYNLKPPMMTEADSSISLFAVSAFCFAAAAVCVIFILLWKRGKKNREDGNGQTLPFEKQLADIEKKYSDEREIGEHLRQDILRLRSETAEKETIINQLKITEAYTGLYRTDYLRTIMEDMISQYIKNGRTFTAAVIDLSPSNQINAQTVPSAARIVFEDLQSFAKCAYDGFGRFLLLFASEITDETSIFIDSTIDHIMTEIPQLKAGFALHTYTGQSAPVWFTLLGYDA